jgi:hypothetical protein
MEALGFMRAEVYNPTNMIGWDVFLQRGGK